MALSLFDTMSRAQREAVATDLTTLGSALVSRMSTQQLTQEAMALPPADRLSLAQALWESIDAGLDDLREGPFYPHDVPSEPEFWEELDRRSREMTDGSAPGIPSHEVMKNARAAIGCA